MFCEKCGKELAEGARFCGSCGAPVEELQTTPAHSACKNNNKRKRTIWLVSAAALAAALGVVLLLVLSGPSLRLQYDWGTSDEEILRNETLLPGTEKYWSDPEHEYYVQCENPDGRIGNLEGFTCDYINYRFYDGELRQAFVYFNERYASLDEYMEQMEKNLGKKHYDEWVFRQHVWWIGDTVVVFSPYDRFISFFEQDYFGEEIRDTEEYRKLAEFFGK